MRKIIARNRFSKEYALMIRRGKDGDKIKVVIGMLVRGEALPLEYRDHPLKGDFKGCRDCHIEPDWLLIYRLNDEALYLERTGTHADIFGK